MKRKRVKKIKKTISLTIATAVVLSAFGTVSSLRTMAISNSINAKATDSAQLVTSSFLNDSVQSIENAEREFSPFASNDYSETLLQDFVETLNLTNTCVKIENRADIEKVIKIIDASEKPSQYDNEKLYLKSLLLKIDSMEMIVADGFVSLYRELLTIPSENVSDSDFSLEEEIKKIQNSNYDELVSMSDCFDMDNVSRYSSVSEMLELYFSYDTSIRDKIKANSPSVSALLDRYIELFEKYSNERSTFLEKYQELLSKLPEEITMEDRDLLVSAVNDFDFMSKSNQGVLENERELLDKFMERYLALKTQKQISSMAASLLENTGKNESVIVVSNSDLSTNAQDKFLQTMKDNKDDTENNDETKKETVEKNDEKNDQTKKEDIGYDVYDTGDASFAHIQLASDILFLSIFMISLMLLLLNEYFNLEIGKEIATVAVDLVYEKYYRLTDALEDIRTLDFDEWSENIADIFCKKIDEFKKSRERTTVIEIELD